MYSYSSLSGDAGVGVTAVSVGVVDNVDMFVDGIFLGGGGL